MGNSAFRSISGIIKAGFDWRAPHPKVLRHPTAHEPMESRVIFHESVHYWQQLGQGFLSKMTEDDWVRLQRFEDTDEKLGVGAYRTEFMRKDDTAGFSAHDLHESLARFWDVHVIGPHRLLEMEFEDKHRNFDQFFIDQYFALKEKGMIVHPQHGGYSDIAFDLAMDAAAGNYAKPYRFVRDRYDSVITGAVFPLAGYFSLQTQNPIQVFLDVIAKVASVLDDLPRGQAIHDLWKACFPIVRDFTLQFIQKSDQAQFMVTGWVIKNGPLREHPVYRWVFSEVDRAAKLLADTDLAEEFGKTYQKAPSGLLGILALDYCLCCPGEPSNRSFLVEWLAPPCIEFADGKRWLLPEFFRRQLYPEITAVEEQLSEQRRQVADRIVDMDKRWQLFRRAVRGY